MSSRVQRDYQPCLRQLRNFVYFLFLSHGHEVAKNRLFVRSGFRRQPDIVSLRGKEACGVFSHFSESTVQQIAAGGTAHDKYPTSSKMQVQIDAPVNSGLLADAAAP